MSKKRLLLFVLITALFVLICQGFTYADGEELKTEDFNLESDIEVDAVTSATMSEYELENPKVKHSEEDIYRMTIDAILVMTLLILAMILPLILRKVMGKHIGSE